MNFYLLTFFHKNEKMIFMENINSSKELEQIQERNRRVEADKAWEQSWTRRAFIGLITYATATLWLFMINDSYPWLKAFVPFLGYILSTLTLQPLRKWWINNRFRRYE